MSKVPEQEPSEPSNEQHGNEHWDGNFQDLCRLFLLRQRSSFIVQEVRLFEVAGIFLIAISRVIYGSVIRHDSI